MTSHSKPDWPFREAFSVDVGPLCCETSVGSSCCNPRGHECSPAGQYRLLDRRDFLRLTGLTGAAVAGSSLLGRTWGLQPPRDQTWRGRSAPRLAADHLVPYDKALDPKWVNALTQRGTVRTFSGSDLLTIGMPVGGIAAGQMYLTGDGRLACWQIFNQNYFSGYGADNYRGRVTPKVGGLEFLLRINNSLVGPISRQTFPDLAFTGTYPIARISYGPVPGHSVELSLDAFSPFVPLNAPDSALPATIFEFTIHNTGTSEVTIEVEGQLINNLCPVSRRETELWGRSRYIESDHYLTLQHSVVPAPVPLDQPLLRPAILIADFENENYGDWVLTSSAFGSAPARGTQPLQQTVSGYLGKGLINTYPGTDDAMGSLTSPPFTIERRFINFLIGGGSHTGDTCINLLIDGNLARTATGKDNELLTWASWDVGEFEGQEAVIAVVDRRTGAWGHINVDHIEMADERRRNIIGSPETLPDSGTLALACRGGRRDPLVLGDDGSAPLDTQYSTAIRGVFSPAIVLKAGESRTVTFVLAWHMPNTQPAGRGHFYSNRFGVAADVTAYVMKNFDELSGRTRLWTKTFYEDSTLPWWLLDRLHSTVANLATGTTQWWKNGRFWAWEGVGCCAGTCTHVWNYAQAMAWLFPQLERSARTMQDLNPEAGYHDNGCVGFRGEDDPNYAADGQCGTVLKCYREHLLSGNIAFLKENWPRIRRALEYSMERDAMPPTKTEAPTSEPDGIIESTQHNTYDIQFEGANSFVTGLYLAALRAGAAMAREMGEDAFAAKCIRLAQRGSEASIERLWNGEYFAQQVDLTRFPKFQYGDGCLADHMLGQTWAHLLDLGHLYPQDMVKSSIRAVWLYNWAPDLRAHNMIHKPDRWFIEPGEGGMLICTWPKSRHLDQGVLYRDEVWTGSEYQVASHLIAEGMNIEGLAVCRAIDDRYHPSKRNPFNEVECGDHYARALSSWGVYLNILGLRYHGPRGELKLNPCLSPEDFSAAFTTAEGWGLLRQTRPAADRQINSISLRFGTLRLNTLTLGLADGHIPVRISATLRPANGGESSIDATFQKTVRAGQVELRFDAPVVIPEGASLEVMLQ